ncbi:MAG: hypothetical protein V4619_00075 [Bacteroidota bacterium]
MITALFSCNRANKIDNKSIVNTDTVELISPPSDTSSIQETPKEEIINTTFSYDGFDVVFHNYSFQETRKNESSGEPEYPGFAEDTTQIRFVNIDDHFFLYPKYDTLTIVEDVFYDLANKLIQIVPKNKADVFKLSISLKQNVDEQFDYTKYPPTKFKKIAQFDKFFENWRANAIRWEGWTNFENIQDSSKYYFRMPLIREENYEKHIKAKLNLRDTLVTVIEPGDYDLELTAKFVYKNKPSYYNLTYALLKIERFSDNKLKATKFIQIWFTEGC